MSDQKKRGGKRLGAGRPTKEIGRKSFAISARVDEIEKIKLKAKDVKKTVSKYIIDLVLNDQ